MAPISEREQILEHMKALLATTPGAAFASRDYSLVLTGQIPEYPAVFILDMGDPKVEEEPAGRSNRRTLRVGIGTVVKGSTSAQAPIELAAFQRAVKKVIYDEDAGVLSIAPVVKGFFETGMSPLIYVDAGPTVVYQEFQMDVLYVESITSLQTE